MSDFISYLHLLLKRWILWLFILGDSIGAIASLLIPNFKVPIGSYWGLATIGVLWASYQVYRDVASQVPALNEHTDLTIDLVEGNEYSYAINESRNALPDQVKDSYLTLNTRLENIGNTEVDIVGITANYSNSEQPCMTWSTDLHSHDGDALSMPVAFKPGDILLCRLKTAISASPRQKAQFAARLARFREKPGSIESTVKVEAVDPRGSFIQKTHAFRISLRPYKDLYVEQWQKEEENELLRLARVPGHYRQSVQADTGMLEMEDEPSDQS